MGYCTKCGKELAIGAQFCVRCGTPANQVRQDACNDVTAKQIRFDGANFLCPGCAGVIGAFDLSCPYCGVEIRNRNSAYSVQDLAERLNQIEAHRVPERARITDVYTKRVSATDERKANCIKSYPIPNTKEDIVEFMLMASSNISDSAYDTSNGYVPQGQVLVADAWKSKMDQAYEKSKLMLSDDNQMEQIERIYQSVNKRISKAKSKVWVILGVIFGCLIGLFLLLLLLMALSFN